MKFEKGKAVPLTSEEKAELALGKAISTNPQWVTTAAWKKSATFGPINASLIDDKQSRYNVMGTCEVSFRCLKRSAILNSKKYTYSVSFQDAKDAWGLPDIKINEALFEELT